MSASNNMNRPFLELPCVLQLRTGFAALGSGGVNKPEARQSFSSAHSRTQSSIDPIVSQVSIASEPSFTEFHSRNGSHRSLRIMSFSETRIRTLVGKTHGSERLCILKRDLIRTSRCFVHIEKVVALGFRHRCFASVCKGPTRLEEGCFI